MLEETDPTLKKQIIAQLNEELQSTIDRGQVELKELLDSPKFQAIVDKKYYKLLKA
jgi:hypothetical protein